jgi:hypothetical protein
MIYLFWGEDRAAKEEKIAEIAQNPAVASI